MEFYCPECHTTYKSDANLYLPKITDPQNSGDDIFPTYKCLKELCGGIVIELDENIMPFIDRLYSLGVQTLWSCSGHYNKDNYEPCITLMDNSNECAFTAALKKYAEPAAELDDEPKVISKLTVTISKLDKPKWFAGCRQWVTQTEAIICIHLPTRLRHNELDSFTRFRNMLSDYTELMDFIDKVEEEAKSFSHITPEFLLFDRFRDKV